MDQRKRCVPRLILLLFPVRALPVPIERLIHEEERLLTDELQSGSPSKKKTRKMSMIAEDIGPLYHREKFLSSEPITARAFVAVS